MKFESVKPYIRFARYLTINENVDIEECVCLDSRLFYVHEGSANLKVGKTTYKMEKHCCLILPQGTEYRILASQKSITYIMLNFDYSQKKKLKNIPIPPVSLKEFSPELIIDSSLPSDTESFSEPLYIQNIKSIEPSLIKIEIEYSHRLKYFEKKMQNLMSDVLIECARFDEVNIKSDLSPHVDTGKILDYIHENFSENLTNKSISDIFGFNPNYISDVIKKHTGFSLHKYLLHIRIMKSLSYLETHSYSINEIANLCGFNSIYYFSKYFKKEMGFSPSKYLK